VSCDGELVANDDGWPTVICRAFHLDGGQVDSDFLCEECEEKARIDNRIRTAKTSEARKRRRMRGNNRKPRGD
jgi:hypothetical protein